METWGIGTSSPQDKLHIFDTSDVSIIVDTQSSSAASYLSLRRGGSKVWSVGQNPIWASGSGDFYIYNDGTQSGNSIGGIVVSQSTGDLGVGTTSPTSKLDVLGETTTDGLVVEKNAGAVDIVGSDHTYLQFYPQGSGSRKGWLGFGSSGSEVLSVQSENDALALNPNGNNVGVGVSNPSQQLDVNGNARIRNNVYTNGNSYTNGNIYTDGQIRSDGAIYENGDRVATMSQVYSKSEVYTKSQVDSMIASAVASSQPSSCSATSKTDFPCSFSFPATIHGEIARDSYTSRWYGSMEVQCNDGNLQVLSSSCRNGG